MKKTKRKKIVIILSILILLVIISFFITNMVLTKHTTKNYIEEISFIFNNSEPLVDLREDNHKEAYRFYYWRSFHPPVLITVHIDTKEGILNLRVSECSQGYETCELKINQDIPLTKEQIKKLRSKARRTLLGFWTPKFLWFGPGVDGSGWTVETKRHGMYFRDYQWSPETGNIREMGEYLLELSQLEIDPNEIY